jgi:hypothetical protein
LMGNGSTSLLNIICLLGDGILKHGRPSGQPASHACLMVRHEQGNPIASLPLPQPPSPAHVDSTEGRGLSLPNLSLTYTSSSRDLGCLQPATHMAPTCFDPIPAAPVTRPSSSKHVPLHIQQGQHCTHAHQRKLVLLAFDHPPSPPTTTTIPLPSQPLVTPVTPNGAPPRLSGVQPSSSSCSSSTALMLVTGMCGCTSRKGH